MEPHARSGRCFAAGFRAAVIAHVGAGIMGTIAGVEYLGRMAAVILAFFMISWIWGWGWFVRGFSRIVDR